MNEQTERSHEIVIAGAGYAGLHTALRLATWLDDRPEVGLTLVDRYPYHQVLTELPRVAAGVRAPQAVSLPLERVLDERVNFVQRTITGIDLAGRRLLTDTATLPYTRLVLALGSRPNDFGIPGLAERALTLWSVDDAKRVLEAVERQALAAAGTDDPQEQQRLLTVVIGGGGATGVELAGELAETLPALARRHGLPPGTGKVILIDSSPTILAGSSAGLIERATQILADLGVMVRLNVAISAATNQGFVLKSGEAITGGVFVWAGGVKASSLVANAGLLLGHNDRVKVDRHLRALDHPDVYVAGDVASVVDTTSGRVLPPTAQIALAEAETVAANLLAEIEGRPLTDFHYHDKGFVVSIGGHSGVADLHGRTLGGRPAHILKDLIEWEYRQSVQHLRGWSVL